MVTAMPQPEVEDRIRAARRILLFLDFDGTLAPIVPDPAEARLDDAMRETLARVSRKEHIIITVISGRALDDVRARIGLPDLVYAGNHGLEIDGPGLHFIEPVAAARREQLRGLTDRLATELRRCAGVLVENKGLTASIHYRRAAEANVQLIEKSVREAVSPVAALFRVNLGRTIFELEPRTGWNKGSAVRWIQARLGGKGSLCIYFGDDRTDEDAFRAVPEAVTFKVGPAAETRAKYRVADPAAVHEFLRWLERHEPPPAAGDLSQ